MTESNTRLRFGIGYEVDASIRASQRLPEENIKDGVFKYILNNLDDRFWCFCDGTNNDCFVAVKDAFDDGLDLTDKKKMLDEELKRLDIMPIGVFRDVGGLYVWRH